MKKKREASPKAFFLNEQHTTHTTKAATRTARILPKKEPEKLTRDDFRSLLGEGFHTAFRKALDSPESAQIWKLIDVMPHREWSAILGFVLSGFPDGAFLVYGKRQRKRQP